MLAPDTGDRELPLSPQLWWESVHNAVGYQVVLALSEDDISNPNAVDRIEASVGRAFFEPEAGLLRPGKTYHWAVRAYDSTGVGPLSEIRTFTTTASADVDPHANTFMTDENGKKIEPADSTEMFPAMRETKSDNPDLLMGRYEIIHELGAGGFATVYKALDNVLNREVALKILRPELLGNDKVRKDFLARFKREAQIVASLEHPHLVPVYDTGIAEVDGHEKPFIVMKLLDGIELEELIEQGPIPVPRVRRLALQALEALEFVHANEITHKDLKPSNFYVCKNYKGEETLYIMDFGIAHDDKDEGGRMTKTGTFSGTVQYLAPEYTLHQQVSPSVDVYQMGLIIIEMLTGSPVIPIETSLPQLIGLHIKGERLQPPDEFAGSKAGEVLARSITFDPEQRYSDAGEFFRAFAKLEESDFPASYSGGGWVDADAALSNPGAPATQQADPVAEAPDVPMISEPPPVAADEGGNKNVVVGVALVLALVGLGAIGLVFAGVGGGDELPEEPPSNNIAAVSETAPAPPVIEEKQPETTPKAVETTPAIAKKKTFAIASSPGGAKVKIDGEEKGLTPFELVLDGDVESFELVLEHDGYKTHTQLVNASKPKPLAIALTKKRSPKSSKKTKPSPPDPPKVEKKPETKPEKKPEVEKKPEKKPEKPTVKPTLPPDF